MASTWDTPAVVVGLNPTALGAVRSLRMGGCRRVIALEANRKGLAIGTRLCDVRFVPNLYDYDALLAELRVVARSCQKKPVLFLSTDEHVVWAARNLDALREHYSCLLPDEELCASLMFKERFAALAAERRYPVPRGAFVATEGLVGAIAGGGMRYPLIIKPSIKTAEWERTFEKAQIVRTADELAAFAAAARGVAGSVMVQEFLEGGDAKVCFCLCVASPELPEPVVFAGRKLFQWPPARGSSAVCEPIDAPELEEFTRRFVRDLGLSGLCSVEVKYGPDGRYRVIEPTVGRPDLQSYLATLNGVNLPLIAYLAAAGEVGAAVEAIRRTRRGKRRLWVYEPAVYQLIRAREVGGRSLLPLVFRRKGFVYLSVRDAGILSGVAGRAIPAALRRLARRAVGAGVSEEAGGVGAVRKDVTWNRR